MAVWESARVKASLNLRKPLQSVNRCAERNASFHLRIQFAAHRPLAVRPVQPAVHITKKRAATRAAVGLRCCREGEFRGCAERTSACDHVAEVVSATRPRGEIGIQEARGFGAGRCSTLDGPQVSE